MSKPVVCPYKHLMMISYCTLQYSHDILIVPSKFCLLKSYHTVILIRLIIPVRYWVTIWLAVKWYNVTALLKQAMQDWFPELAGLDSSGTSASLFVTVYSYHAILCVRVCVCRFSNLMRYIVRFKFWWYLKSVGAFRFESW